MDQQLHHYHTSPPRQSTFPVNQAGGGHDSLTGTLVLRIPEHFAMTHVHSFEIKLYLQCEGLGQKWAYLSTNYVQSAKRRAGSCRKSSCRMFIVYGCHFRSNFPNTPPTVVAGLRELSSLSPSPCKLTLAHVTMFMSELYPTFSLPCTLGLVSLGYFKDNVYRRPSQSIQ